MDFYRSLGNVYSYKRSRRRITKFYSKAIRGIKSAIFVFTSVKSVQNRQRIELAESRAARDEYSGYIQACTYTYTSYGRVREVFMDLATKT